MLLEFELLMDHCKRSCDFECQISSKTETHAIQENFCNEESIGHNHGDLPKECF